VKSKVGQGSLFWFILCLPGANQEARNTVLS